MCLAASLAALTRSEVRAASVASSGDGHGYSEGAADATKAIPSTATSAAMRIMPGNTTIFLWLASRPRTPQNPKPFRDTKSDSKVTQK